MTNEETTAVAEPPKKLSSTERATRLEEQLEKAIGVIQTQESRLQALEGRLNEAPSSAPIEGDFIDLPKTATKSGARAFVCPQGPNVTYLVVPGKVMQIRDPNSPTGFRDYAREGDVKLRFKNGIWWSQTDDGGETEDVKRFEWLEAHPEIARDVAAASTAVWFELKQGQMETSRRNSTFSKNIDVDRAIAGEVQELTGTGENIVESARKQLVPSRG